HPHSKKQTEAGLAVGIVWVLLHALFDCYIDRILRTAEIPFSCYAMGYHVCSLVSWRVMYAGALEIAQA
ncbi:MAG: hypothetical protein ABIN99_11390, partial [Nitrosospira sp.]